MARSSSGFVAGLTAAALAAVGFLAWQASAAVPPGLGGDGASAGPSARADRPSESGGAEETALPATSGKGQRVVYSLGRDRVWLVGADGKAGTTFEVTPGTVDPALGTTRVWSRSQTTTGSDGVPIERVVRFAQGAEVPIGFSAAVDGSTPPPDPAKRTGGIREAPADARAMWEFAGIGTTVVVVP